MEYLNLVNYYHSSTNTQFKNIRFYKGDFFFDLIRWPEVFVDCTSSAMIWETELNRDEFNLPKFFDLVAEGKIKISGENISYNEYRNRKDWCVHTNCLDSKTIISNGNTRLRKTCLDCGNFMGWLPTTTAEKAIIYFGKYKGKTFFEIAKNDPDYLKWLSSQEIKPRMKQLIEESLKLVNKTNEQ